jgi:hypothetical protein
MVAQMHADQLARAAAEVNRSGKGEVLDFHGRVCLCSNGVEVIR